MISPATKARVTRRITHALKSSNEATASEISADVVDIIENDLAQDVRGYEPQVVEHLMQAMLDVILDGRRALDFGGHSIPASVLKRIQEAVDNGKMHTVRF